MNKYYIAGQVTIGLAIIGFLTGSRFEEVMLGFVIATSFFVQGLYKRI